MEIQALRARIQPALHQDFDAVREEFVAETGTDDPRAFVHHLREWELIPFDLANALLIELAVERAPEDEDDEEPQDATAIMRWDDDAGDVDPEAATKHHDRAELLGWVDDPSEAHGEMSTGYTMDEETAADPDAPDDDASDDEIDPEADTIHLDRRVAILGEEEAARRAAVSRPPDARTPRPQVRDPANTPTAAAVGRVQTPAPAPARTPAPLARVRTPAPLARVHTPAPIPAPSPAPIPQRQVSERREAPDHAHATQGLADVPTLVSAPPAAAPAASAAAAPAAPVSLESTSARGLPVDPSGRFQFLEILDEDGLARTVLTLDTGLGRHVALRLMNHSVAAHAPLLHRFKTEARATSQLDHPGIPAIHDFYGPEAYFHRLLEGEPLSGWLTEARAALDARRPLPAHLTTDALLERFVQVCDILAHAHARGLIHRDLRPDNILVGPFGATWVVDWGLAMVVDENAPNAVTLEDPTDDRRVLVGTAGYCSPEQANGRVQGLDIRSDVYTLGLVLFEILALKPAVGAPSVAGRLVRQQQGQIDPLVHAVSRPNSAALSAIVARATTTDPSQRYVTATALADDVRRALRGQPIAARRDSLLVATGRLFARHPAFVWTVLAMLVLGWTLTLVLAVVVYST